MKRTLKMWSGYLAVVFLLASCAPTAHFEKDENADFSRYKTFSWVDKDGNGDKDRNNSNDLAEQNIRRAVTRELEKAGWRESKRSPDVLLSYDVLVERSIKEQSYWNLINETAWAVIPMMCISENGSLLIRNISSMPKSTMRSIISRSPMKVLYYIPIFSTSVLHSNTQKRMPMCLSSKANHPPEDWA